MADKSGKLEIVIKGGKPWGFHIQANEGSGSSVVVCNIMPGGKSYQQNILQVGDHILRINGVPCLSIKDAFQLIDSAFRTLTLSVWRPGTVSQDFVVYSNYENMNTFEKQRSSIDLEPANVYENVEFRKEERNCSVPYNFESRSSLNDCKELNPENVQDVSLERSKSSCVDFSNDKYYHLPSGTKNQNSANIQVSTHCVPLNRSNELGFDRHFNPNERVDYSSQSNKKSGFRKLDSFKSHFKKLLNKPEQSVPKEYQKCIYPNCSNQQGSCVVHSPPEKENNLVTDAIYVNTTYMGKCNASKAESKQISQKHGVLSKYFSKGTTNRCMTKTLSLSSVYSSASNMNYETMDDQAISKKIRFFSALGAKPNSLSFVAQNPSPSYRHRKIERNVCSNSSGVRDSISSISSCSSNLSAPPREISSKLSNFSSLGDKSNSISDNSSSNSPIQLDGINSNSGFGSSKFNLEFQKYDTIKHEEEKTSHIDYAHSLSCETSPDLANSPVFQDFKTSCNFSLDSSYESDEFILQTKNICNRLFSKSKYKTPSIVEKSYSISNISRLNSSDENNLNSSFESTKFLTAFSTSITPQTAEKETLKIVPNLPCETSIVKGLKNFSDSSHFSTLPPKEYIPKNKTLYNSSLSKSYNTYPVVKVEDQSIEKETKEERGCNKHSHRYPVQSISVFPQQKGNANMDKCNSLLGERNDDKITSEEAIYANVEDTKKEFLNNLKIKEMEEHSMPIENIIPVESHQNSVEQPSCKETSSAELVLESKESVSTCTTVSVKDNVECVKDTDRELNRCSSQSPSSTTYLSTSVPKAKLLTQYTSLLKNNNVDIKELSSEKDELINRIDKKLNILKEEKMGLENELKQNEILGLSIKENLEKSASPNEIEKYTRHVDELEKIIHLLKILSGRIARIESALQNLPANAENSEKALLSRKLAKLKQQHEEAIGLQKNINNRNNNVSVFLSKYLTKDELADYDHFIHMKVELLEDYKELIEKIKLGEEQLLALKEQ